MPYLRSLKETLLLAMRSVLLVLFQVVGNIAIFIAFVLALRVPESNIGYLLLDFLLFALVVLGMLVLQGGTLNYFVSAHSEKKAPLIPAFTKALRHILALALWAVVFYLLWRRIGWLETFQYTFPGWLRADLPAWLRKHTTDTGFASAYAFMLFLLTWLILPSITLPLAQQCADKGFRGLFALRTWLRTLLSANYWTVLVLANLFLYAAIKVANWKLSPNSPSLHAEELSAIFRLGFAYVLVLAAWLLVCSVLGKLRASEGQATA